MWQRFTERARKAVFYAQEEAGRLGGNSVCTEHLLLGLIRENDNVATRVLERMSFSLESIRSEVKRQIAQSDERQHAGSGHRWQIWKLMRRQVATSGERQSQDMQLTPRAKRVIDLMYNEALQLNHNYFGTEHLLLGLIREGQGLAGRTLTMLGVDLEQTRLELKKLQGRTWEEPG